METQCRDRHLGLAGFGTLICKSLEKSTLILVAPRRCCRRILGHHGGQLVCRLGQPFSDFHLAFDRADGIRRCTFRHHQSAVF